MVNKPFDPTKPVRTRGGLPARIICTDRAHESGYHLVYLIKEKHESVWSARMDGESSSLNKDNDLVNIPEKVTVHVYRREDGSYYTYHKEIPQYAEWFVKQVEIEV